MGRLPQELEEKRQRLARAARRGAFDSYVRHGRVPDLYSRISQAVDEAKSLGAGVSLPPSGASPLPAGRPTTHYTWRTAGDDRVRDSHAALNRRVFAWANPPAHGHPGHAPNCRCWPEPYYGDPAVPDELLHIVRERRFSGDPDAPWVSIDKLTRPDGSLAGADFVGRDGIRISSSFVGSKVSHTIGSPRSRSVRVEKHGGVVSSYLDGQTQPLVQGQWKPRSSLLFQRDPLWPEHMIYADPDGPGSGPGSSGSSASAVAAMAALTQALIDLYNRASIDPASVGAGTQDVTVLVFKAWEVSEVKPGEDPMPVPIMADTLSEEQLRQACRLLPEVQEWTDMAALQLAHKRSEMSPANWGTIVHKAIKDLAEAVKMANPFAYGDVFAELSLSDVEGTTGQYGQKGTIRVDIVERLIEDGPPCFYDIKTGAEGLTPKRLRQIAAFVAKHYGDVIFYIIEVRPKV